MSECVILVTTLVVGYIFGRLNTPTKPDDVIAPFPLPEPRVSSHEIKVVQENFELRQTVHQLQHEIWHLKSKEKYGLHI